ncbi:multicystatin-like [Cornus florida]|uniref:multicystatin-like n=1 Tax=Cornus florida TaxID=4283 RepID=UPI0028A20A39|nr:multicystatin-like [Cornus florida]
MQKMMSEDFDSDDEREFALMLSNANITIKMPEVPAHRETVQETDSDDEEKTNELFWQYRKQVADSNGFEVDKYPLLSSYLGLISPISWVNESEGLPKRIEKLSKKAIRQYDRDYKVNYDFVKVQKANQSLVAGFIYYITFEAKDANDGGSKIFQAEVFDGIEKTEVVSCRPKPPT